MTILNRLAEDADLAAWLVVAISMIILVVSIFGGEGNARTDIWARLAWLSIMVYVAILEIVLILTGHPTLSSQMQWWIKNTKAGDFMVIFWFWWVWHAVFEPTVQRVSIRGLFQK